jgi:hypothetical protein
MARVGRKRTLTTLTRYLGASEGLVVQRLVVQRLVVH